MRSRAVLLIVAILLVAAFAALNWPEFLRTQPLLLGPVMMDAPLGLIMLCLLGLTLIAFLTSTIAMSTRSLMDYRDQQKSLEAQRLLADKAEASRFTELRTYMDTQLRELRQRDAIAATELEKAMVGSQRELRTQLEQMNRMLASRLTEMEGRMGLPARAMPAGTVPPVLTPERTDVSPARPVRAEHALAEEAREQRMLEEERVRAEDQRLREERGIGDKPVAKDRPAESGWRRWF
jgi:hypothetical protein